MNHAQFQRSAFYWIGGWQCGTLVLLVMPLVHPMSITHHVTHSHPPPLTWPVTHSPHPLTWSVTHSHSPPSPGPSLTHPTPSPGPSLTLTPPPHLARHSLSPHPLTWPVTHSHPTPSLGPSLTLTPPPLTWPVPQFFQAYMKLLQSGNYVTRRQSLKVWHSRGGGMTQGGRARGGSGLSWPGMTHMSPPPGLA